MMDKTSNLMLANDPINFIVMHGSAMSSTDFDREYQFSKVHHLSIQLKLEG